MQPTQKIDEQLDQFKNLLYGNEDTVLTKQQFEPLKELICNLATDHRELISYLPKLLPLSLKLLDHHDSDLKIIGVKCIDSLVTNVPVSHLSQSGTDLVILDVLTKSVNHIDIECVKWVLPLLVKCCKLFKLQVKKVEELFLQIHQLILMANEMEKKSFLWSTLPNLIDLLGMSSVKFLSHYIIPLFVDQMSFPLEIIRNGKSTSDVIVVTLFINVLSTVNKLLSIVPKERISSHFATIMLSLGKFIFSNSKFFETHLQVNEKGDSSNDEGVKLFNCTKETIKLLKSLDCEKYEKLCKILIEEIVKPPQDSNVVKVTDDLIKKKKVIEGIFC